MYDQASYLHWYVLDIRFIDTLFYDYIVESPWFKKEWKEKYEAAKKSAIRWADYGPPYREDSNQVRNRTEQ